MKPRGPIIPTLSLAGGIVAGHLIGMPWWIGLIPIVLALAFYYLLLSFSDNPVRAFRLGRWHLAWVIILFAGIGLIDEALNRPIPLSKDYAEMAECEVISVLSKTYGDRMDVVVKGTNGGKARIRTGVTDINPGDIVSVPIASLVEISKDTTEIGRRIAPMMKANGFLYSGWIPPKYIVTTGRSNSLRHSFSNYRDNIEATIDRSHLSKSTSSFLNAILMGDKTGLNEETRLTFANGGTAHILALSGLHLSILAGIIIMLIIPLKYAGKYKWGYALAIIMLWTYVCLTGMAYSSVRACLMISLAFIAIILERKNFSGNALSSACMLILLFDPSALFDAGFQLSVVCVGALIAFATPLNPIGHRNHPKLHSLCGALIATMVATAASWVLTSYYFSQIPLMFLPTNLIILPLLPAYIVVALIYVVFLCCGYEFMILGHLLDKGYDFFVRITKTLSGGTEFVVDYQMPLWGVLGWLLILSAAAWFLNKKQTSL